MSNRFGGIPVEEEAQQIKSGVTNRFGGIPVEDNLQAIDNNIQPPNMELETEPSIQQPEQQDNAGMLHGIGTKILDQMRGGDRHTVETIETPEISKLSTGDKGRDLRISLGVLATADPALQIKIIKKAAPDAKIETDEKGNTFVEFDEGGRFVLNKPGLSEIDILRTVGQIAPFIAGAGLISGVKAIVPKFLLGAGIAGGLEAGTEGAAAALGAGKEAFSPLGIGSATVLGGASELVAPAIQAAKVAKQRKLFGAAIPSDMTRPSVDAARTAQEGLKKATGVNVPIFTGQQTNIPVVLQKQSFMGQLTAGAEKSMESLKKQNKQVYDATKKLISLISDSDAIITGPGRTREAAKTAIERLKGIRTDKTQPLFKTAYYENADINTAKVIKKIDDLIDRAAKGGYVEGKLKRFRGQIKSDKIKTKMVDSAGKKIYIEKKPTSEQLHNTSKEMNDMLKKENVGDQTRIAVRDIQKTLVKELEDSSVTFKRAFEKYRELSPEVDKLERSIIGTISRVNDTNLKDIRTKLFNPKELDETVLKKAKKVLDEVDPGAWDDILRSEFQGRLGSLKLDLEKAELTAENIPGQLYSAIFGNQAKRDILYSGMNKSQKENFKYLETVLDRARKGRTLGSQTAANEEIKKELRGVSGVFRSFFKKPIDTLAETGESAMFDKNVRVMTEMVFNPEWQVALSKIKQIDTRNPASARAMTQLLKDIDYSLGGKKDD